MPRHTLRPNSDTVQAGRAPFAPAPRGQRVLHGRLRLRDPRLPDGRGPLPARRDRSAQVRPPGRPDFRVAGTNVPTAFTGFPEVSKEFYILKAQLAHHIQKNLTASVLCWKQKYDNIDWQTQTEPYMGKVDPGSNRWFFLGAQVPSYDANILRAALTYTF